MSNESGLSISRGIAYLKERKSRAKIIWTVGFLMTCYFKLIMLLSPENLYDVYIKVMVPLMIYRVFDFIQVKQDAFLLEFCYAVNISFVIQSSFFPDHISWFQMNYILCIGPLSIQILFWQWCVPSHSIRNITSFYLHFYPAVTMQIRRWTEFNGELPIENKSISYFTNSSVFMYPVYFYVVWQCMYIATTEVILKSYLRKNSRIGIMSYIYKDKKILASITWKKILLSFGIVKKKEELCPNTWQGKVIFMATQAILTGLAILYGQMISIHCWSGWASITFLFIIGVKNGANSFFYCLNEN